MSSSNSQIFESLNLAGKFEDLLKISSKENTTEARYWEILALFRLGRVQESQKAFTKYINEFKTPLWQMKLCNLQSTISKNIGDFETALECANRCIAMTEVHPSLKYLEEKGRAYNNIGEVYRILGNSQKCLDFYFQGYNIFIENGIQNEIEIFLLNIGMAYRALGKLSEAEAFLLENYRIAINKGNPQYLTYSLVELIELEVRRDHDKAREHLFTMKEISEENPNHKRISLHFQYAQGLVFKFSPRNRDKVKGEMIFEKLIETNDIEVYYTLEAIPHLIELLLIEFANYQEVEVYQEMERYLVLLYNIGTQKRMNKYIIKSLIIQSKLKCIKGQIADAGMLLDDAIEISKRYDLKFLLSQIQDAKEDMSKLINQSGNTHEITGKLEFSSLIDYLRNVQGALKKS